MTPDQMILDLLASNPDIGIGTLWFLMRGNGVKNLTTQQVGTIVDLLILKGKVKPIEGRHATMYSLAEPPPTSRKEINPPPVVSELDAATIADNSLTSRIARKKARRNEYLRKVEALSAEIEELESRHAGLMEIKREARARLKALREEAEGGRGVA